MVLHHGCFHIRKSTDQCLFAAPRGLSQLVTSFIGSWCQGIHLMLLFAWTSCKSVFRPFAELTFGQFGSHILWIAWVSKNWFFAAKRLFHPFAFSTFRWNCLPLIGKTYSRRVNCMTRSKSLSSLSVFSTLLRFIRFSMILRLSFAEVFSSSFCLRKCFSRL